MLMDFITVAGQVFTLFLMMAVGYALSKLGWFSEATSGQATKLLLYVVAPSIIITQLQMDATAEVVRSMLMGALGMLVPFLSAILVSQFLFRKAPPETASSCRFALVYGNNTFMGLPLLLGILGPDAMIYGVLCLIIFTIFQWTHGVVIMGGKVNLRTALINPGVIGLAIGLVLFATGLRLPAPVNTAMTYINGLNTPLAMVVIGAQMARSDILAALKKARLYVTVLLRLLLVPTITAAVTLLLRLSPMSYCACVVMAACPCAGATAMFAQMFHRDQETAAQLITLSTLLSIITLPIFAVIARTVSGMA